MAILAMNAKRQGYVIAEDASKVVRKMLEGMTVSERLDFGNARGMRNTLEKLVQEQANRLAGMTGEITKEDALVALHGEEAVKEEKAQQPEAPDAAQKPKTTEELN